MAKTNKNDQLNQQLEDYKAKYLRTLADYQNLEKRSKEDQIRFAKIANLSLLSELLAVYDHLETAASHLNDSGLNMVLSEFEQFLKTQNVESVDALNHPFNPATMECIETREGKSDQVLEVAQKGYLLGDTLLRPAKVVVGKETKNQE